MKPRRPKTDELDAVVAFICAAQGDPTRQIAYLGTDIDGILVELEALTPPWTDTVRIVSVDGSVVGAALVEVDTDVHRAWVQGPWVAGGDAAWGEHAAALLDCVTEQLPGDGGDMEVAGHVDNVRLAALVEERGWNRGVASHALIADEPTISAWPVASGHDLRPVRPGDADGITRLHDSEFPGTYVTGSELEARALRGDMVALVSTRPGVGVVAYAAGQVHPDGEGFIDFVAVDPSWQRRGLGRQLVVTLARTMLPRCSQQRICLMVQDPRTAARGLYASLGFRSDGSFVGYRRTEPNSTQ